MRQPMPRSAPLAVGVLWIGKESVARVSAATPGTLSCRRDAAPGYRCAHPDYQQSLDNIPIRIIVRIVLSVRGASRGVVKRDRSPGGRPAGEGLAKLRRCSGAELDAASCAVWLAPTSSGRQEVAVRRYYERLPIAWLDGTERGGRNPRAPRARKNGPDAKRSPLVGAP